MIKTTFLTFLTHFWKIWAQIRDQWRILVKKLYSRFFERLVFKKLEISGYPKNIWKIRICQFLISWAKKKTSLYFLDQNSSLITNLRSDSSKMSQKYETSWFYHFKILKITEKSTNLKKSRVRRSFLKILIIDSWSVKNLLQGKI